MEAKNETFARSIPINISPGKPPRNSQSVLRPGGRSTAGDPVGGVSLLARYNKPRGHAFAVTDVRETLRTVRRKTLKMVRYRWRAGVVKPGCGASDPERRRRWLLPR